MKTKYLPERIEALGFDAVEAEARGSRDGSAIVLPLWTIFTTGPPRAGVSSSGTEG